jgi:hypothetical protein
MPVFRLSPIDRDHPSWAGSSHKDVCEIRAASEDAARALAHERFGAGSGPDALSAPSPWKNLDLVRAEVMEETGQRADGPAQVLVPFGYS